MQNQLIDETITTIKKRETLEFVSVNGKEITVRAKDRCFISNDILEYCELEACELNDNELTAIFKLLV